MTAQVTELTFIAADGVTEYPFIPNTSQKVKLFEASFAPRGQDRPRGAQHGTWPRFTYFGQQAIHHEGVIVGADGAATTTERNEMLSALLGDLAAAPTTRKLGSLLVVIGDAISGRADVTIESYTCPLRADRPTTIDYAISWIAFGPFLDAHGHPVIV